MRNEKKRKEWRNRKKVEKGMKIKGGMSRKAGREREGKRMKRKIATVRTENLFLLRPKINQNGRKEIRKNYEREERRIKKKNTPRHTK